MKEAGNKMVYEGVLEGKYVDLRSCTEDDAEFTLALRTDPKLGKYFPKIQNTVEQQREWIRKQRSMEGDYFFIVCNKEGERIGTIAVYNIAGDIGEGGRTIMRSDNPFEVSEAQLLLDRFAFHVLGLKLRMGFIYEENKRAIRFNKQFSGRLSNPEEDGDGRAVIRIETTKEEFDVIDKKISAVIYRQSRRRGGRHGNISL